MKNESIEISIEELTLFAKKIYQEACFGYMDLKDSVCENLIEEFLEDKKEEIKNKKQISQLKNTVTSANPYADLFFTSVARTTTSTSTFYDPFYSFNDPAYNVVRPYVLAGSPTISASPPATPTTDPNNLTNNLTNNLLNNNYSLNTTNLNIQSNDTSPRPE